MYSTLVRKGGIIAFHDVASNYGDAGKAMLGRDENNFPHREHMVHPENSTESAWILK